MISFEAARAKGDRDSLRVRVCAPERETLDLSVAPAARSAAFSPKTSSPTATIRHSIVRFAMVLQCAPPTQPSRARRLRLIGESRAGVAFDGTVGSGRMRADTYRRARAARRERRRDARIHSRRRRFRRLRASRARRTALRSRGRGSARGRSSGCREARGSVTPNLPWPRKWAAPSIEVSRRPRVAILSTGDELVSLGRRSPGPFRFATATIFRWPPRSASRAASPCPQAPRRTKSPSFARESSRAWRRIMLLLSGGVSVGKYDLVEQVLKDLGAEILFRSGRDPSGQAGWFSHGAAGSPSSVCREIPFPRW